jgi:hypothetical protein
LHLIALGLFELFECELFILGFLLLLSSLLHLSLVWLLEEAATATTALILLVALPTIEGLGRISCGV